MYMRIVVGLDGSEFAEQVLPHVAALATKFGSVVTLLRATTIDRTLVHLPADRMPEGVPANQAITMAEAERYAATTYLASVARQMSDQSFTVEYEAVPGSAAEVIVGSAGRLGADLIAMTTHGAGGLNRVVFGSVAGAVLHKAPCPILLVRVSGPR